MPLTHMTVAHVPAKIDVILCQSDQNTRLVLRRCVPNAMLFIIGR